MKLKRSWIAFFKIPLENTKFGPLYEGTPCILYQGRPNKAGYCRITVDGERNYLHRFSYEVYYKESPADVHHLCERKNCYNPLHLESKSHPEHVGEHKRQRFCWRGHDKDVYGRYSDGHCKQCTKEKNERKIYRDQRK